MKLSNLLLTFGILAASQASALTIDLTPGSLESLLKDNPSYTTETTLTITGSIDARDFTTLSTKMTQLTELNLSDATIEAYIPASVSGTASAQYDVNTLPDHALFSMHLTSVTLPTNLTAIGQGALADNDFSSITIPDGVTTIGSHAFYDDSALTAISLPASVSSIGDYTFAGCTALVNANLSDTSITELPAYAFSNCTELTSVVLPTAVTTIGDNAFASCSSLLSITLPASLSTIGNQAFYESGLQNISLPSSVKTVGDYAFAKCPQLSTATFAASDMNLGEGIFYYDPDFVTLNTPEALKIIPAYTFTGGECMRFDANSLQGIEEVGDYALMGNTSEALNLGSTLVYLGNGAMEDMQQLANVNAELLEGNVPELGDNVFTGVNQADAILHVAADYKQTWAAAPQWNDFKISGIVSVTDNIITSNDVHAYLTGSILHIVALEPITAANVYAPDGHQVTSDSPAALSTEIDLSDTHENVYIITVRTAKGLYTFKLSR